MDVQHKIKDGIKIRHMIRKRPLVIWVKKTLMPTRKSRR